MRRRVDGEVMAYADRDHTPDAGEPPASRRDGLRVFVLWVCWLILAMFLVAAGVAVI